MDIVPAGKIEGCNIMFTDEKNAYIDPIELGLKQKSIVANGQVFKITITSRYNVVLLLLKHPYFEHLGYNEFNRTITFNSDPLTDVSLSKIACWMEALYDIRPSTSLLLECVNQVGENKSYNPLAEYFKNKKWDKKKKRLETLLIDYFGAPDTKLVRAYSKKFFIGAIKRALHSTVQNPVKHDVVLVLFGRQGLKKSTAIETLAIKNEWFGDIPLDISNKDTVLMLNGRLLYEMKELAKRSKDRELEKAFLDTKIDSLRLPYGKLRMDIPRKTSFIATTNRLDILNDATGSRRWWPVMCGYYWKYDDEGNVIDMVEWEKGKTIDIDALKKDVEQLWLEALHYTKDKNEIWWLDNDEELARNNDKDAFVSRHPWYGIVETITMSIGAHFKTEDIINKMSLETRQKDHKTRIVVESIITEMGYTKKKVRIGKKTYWRWKK